MGSRRVRLLFGLSLVVALLAFAGAAAGDTTTFNDALVVGTEQSPDVTLLELVSIDNGTMSSFELDVPAGYTLDPAQPGAKLADLIAVTRAGGLATGALTVADPASYTDPAVLACDSQTHVAVWSMTFDGTSINVPWFIDAAPSGGYSARVCLPAAQFGGASTATPLAGLVAEFDGTLHAPPAGGTYTWDALVTPFGSDGQTPDATKVIDFQAVVPLPVALTMKVAYNAHTKFATLNGHMSFAGKPAAGYTLDITAAKTLDGLPADVGSAQVAADGSFSYPVLVSQSEYLFADPEPVQSPCTSANASVAGCFSTEYPLAEATARVTVTKPKPVVKKKAPPKCKKGQKSTKKHPCRR